MKHIFLPVLLLLLATGCRKDNKDFKLKTIRLTAYQQPPVPQQVQLRVIAGHNGPVLGSSGLYPTQLPLPAVLGIQPAVSMQLYRQGCVIELWGDVSGLLGSCELDMHEYKIIFPLEMEVHSPALSVSLSGSWE